jgi:hypothetical protein
VLCLNFGEAGVTAQCVVYEKGAECCAEADRAGKAYMILGGYIFARTEASCTGESAGAFFAGPLRAQARHFAPLRRRSMVDV